jgi:hypothetical protein
MVDGLNTEELEALISLIDDPDESVYNHVRDRIVSLGTGIIPHLENIWELNSFGHPFQQRIEDIIHNIQFDAVKHSLSDWSRSGGEDLFEGAMLVARYQYPDMDELEVKNQLMKIRQDIWLELNEDLTAFETVKIFNHILFKVYGFRGNKKNYHAAQNSYINTVLESKKGNALTLSIIYISLAQSLGIPIKGVNLPNHFLLAYVDEYNIIRFINKTVQPNAGDSDILFYLNAFSSGALVHKDEIHLFLEKLKIPALPEYTEPCTNRTMVIRLLTNLIFSYDRLGYPEKVEELKELLKAVDQHKDQNPKDHTI